MIDQETINSALGSLIGWLESWRDSSGAYNGFVVHRTETKRMGRVHDTAWTQSAMVRGYANLYRKGGEFRWREKMVEAADLLASRHDPGTGRIRFTGHEDDRFQSLVSCALCICAILNITDLVDETRRKDYIRIASDHARRYWLDTLWVESEGAFKATETDFYSPGEDRFIVNFNTMAAEALLMIYQATGEEMFRERALRTGQWLIERWEHAKEYNDRILEGQTTVADDPLSEWMAPGGMPYQFNRSPRDPDNYVTIYTGLSLRGFGALYRATGDKRYAKIIEEQSVYILAMRDPDTRLFYHTAKKGRLEKNPQFVAGAGMTMSGLYEVCDLLGDRAVPADTLGAILDRAYVNGSYPGFIGKNDTGNARRRGGGIVWEDVAASANWNAQLFEYLTLLAEGPGKIVTSPCTKTVSIASRRFVYRDSPRHVQIISWWPVRSWGIFIYTKKRPSAWLSFYPIIVYRNLLYRMRGAG